jgi:hypothetical protein
MKWEFTKTALVSAGVVSIVPSVASPVICAGKIDAVMLMILVWLTGILASAVGIPLGATVFALMKAFLGGSPAVRVISAVVSVGILAAVGVAIVIKPSPEPGGRTDGPYALMALFGMMLPYAAALLLIVTATFGAGLGQSTQKARSHN